MNNHQVRGSYKLNPFIHDKNQSIFAGVGVAVVTPFNDKNEIDISAIFNLTLFF